MIHLYTRFCCMNFECYEGDFKMARNGCESDRPRDTIGIMISKWPIYFLLWGIRTFRNFSIDVRSYDIMIVPNFKMAHFVCLLSHMDHMIWCISVTVILRSPYIRKFALSIWITLFKEIRFLGFQKNAIFELIDPCDI